MYHLHLPDRITAVKSQNDMKVWAKWCRKAQKWLAKTLEFAKAHILEEMIQSQHTEIQHQSAIIGQSLDCQSFILRQEKDLPTIALKSSKL